jgi:hypothetical protein
MLLSFGLKMMMKEWDDEENNDIAYDFVDSMQ